jgi:hypothetical protein
MIYVLFPFLRPSSHDRTRASCPNLRRPSARTPRWSALLYRKPARPHSRGRRVGFLRVRRTATLEIFVGETEEYRKTRDPRRKPGRDGEGGGRTAAGQAREDRRVGGRRRRFTAPATERYPPCRCRTRAARWRSCRHHLSDIASPVTTRDFLDDCLSHPSASCKLIEKK